MPRKQQMSSDYLGAHLRVSWKTKNLRANFFHRSDLSSFHMQLDHQTLVLLPILRSYLCSKDLIYSRSETVKSFV